MRLSYIFSLIIGVAAFASVTAYVSAKDEKSQGFSREEIEEIVTETIMKKPEIIVQAVQELQTREERKIEADAKKALEENHKIIYDSKNSPVIGNPKGDVTLVEFVDYNCGYCKQSLPNIMKLVKNDENLRIIIKDYPVIAPTSAIAAQAALTVHTLMPEKYFDYHAALFRMGGRFNKERLASVAVAMGIDKDTFLEKLDSKDIESKVDANRKLAQELRVRGVPYFIIGGKTFPGAVSYTRLKDAIAEVRAKN